MAKAMMGNTNHVHVLFLTEADRSILIDTITARFPFTGSVEQDVLYEMLLCLGGLDKLIKPTKL